MTEDTGLTAEQMQQLQNWLTSKTRGKAVACAVCTQSQWTVLDSFVALSTVDATGTDASAAYPHVALSCAHCGHTLLLNALKAGIWT